MVFTQSLQLNFSQSTEAIASQHNLNCSCRGKSGVGIYFSSNETENFRVVVIVDGETDGGIGKQAKSRDNMIQAVSSSSFIIRDFALVSSSGTCLRYAILGIFFCAFDMPFNCWTSCKVAIQFGNKFVRLHRIGSGRDSGEQ